MGKYFRISTLMIIMILIFLLSSLAMPVYAIDNLEWTRINLEKGSIISACDNGNIIVAVRCDWLEGKMINRALVSTDGLDWKEINVNIGQYVVWNGKEFVAIGTEKIARSKDGLNWMVKDNPYKDKVFKSIRNVSYLNGKYIAVGGYLDGNTLITHAAIFTSEDGEKWKKSIVKEYVVQDVIYNGKKYVAVGYSARVKIHENKKEENDGIILISDDGYTWKEQSKNIPNLYSVAWNGEQFVALGQNGTEGIIVMRSTNAVDWTKNTIGIDRWIRLNDTIWDGKQFIAVGTKCFILTSTDGMSWVKKKTPADEDELEKNIFFKEKYIVLGGSGLIMASQDGEKWNIREGSVRGYLSGIVSNEKMFVAIGDNASILTSSDGIRWKKQLALEDQYRLHSITSNGVQFVAVGYCEKGGLILTSSNGEDWTQMIIDLKGAYGYINDIIWDGDKFVGVLVGNEREIITSIDGLKWERKNINTRAYFSKITWNGTQYAAATGNSILFSKDLENWEESQLNITERINRIVWAGERYFVLGENGLILTSYDGESWSKQTVNSKESMKDAFWSGMHYIVISETGTILTSKNGSNWIIRNLGKEVYLNAVGGNSRKVIVVGNREVYIAQRPITVTLNERVIDFDTSPAIVKGRTMVPLRGVFEALGMSLEWDPKARTIHGKRDGIEIYLAVGNDYALVNGLKVILDVPATIIEGRTMVPVRFIAESTGAKVAWNEKNRVVEIVTEQ